MLIYRLFSDSIIMLYYDKEVFRDEHVGFLITSTWNLSDYSFSPEEYLKVLGSSIRLPILSIIRKDNVELFKTYCDSAISLGNDYNKYAKYKSESNILFFRNSYKYIILYLDLMDFQWLKPPFY